MPSRVEYDAVKLDDVEAPQDEVNAVAVPGFAGLLYMVCSALTFSVMSLIIHVLSVSRGLPAYEQIWFRGLIGAAMTGGYLAASGVSLAGSRDKRKLLLLRGVFGFLGMFLNWMSITNLQFGEGTSVVFSAPAMTAIIARFYLKESIGVLGACAVALSFVGVLLIARPAFLFGPGGSASAADGSVEIPGAVVTRLPMILLGLCGAACSATTNVFVRQLQSEHPLVVVFYLMCCCVALAPLFIPLSPLNLELSLKDVLCLGAIGVLGALGQALKTRGLQLEKAGLASAMRLIDLLMAFVFQATIFYETEPVSKLSALGASIIVVSVLLVGCSKL